MQEDIQQEKRSAGMFKAISESTQSAVDMVIQFIRDAIRGGAGLFRTR